jgi:hypothetical protein
VCERAGVKKRERRRDEREMRVTGDEKQTYRECVRVRAVCGKRKLSEGGHEKGIE